MTATETRTCKQCGRTLPITAYYRSGTGGRYRYRTCKTCILRNHQRKRQGQPVQRHTRYNARGEIRCSRCERYLSADHFKRHPSRPGTWWSYCRECTRVLDRERYARKTSTLDGALADLEKRYARKERARKKTDEARTRFVRDGIRSLVARGLTKAEIARLRGTTYGSLLKWERRSIRHTPGRRPITPNVEERVAILLRHAAAILPTPGTVPVTPRRRLPHPDYHHLLALCEPEMARYPLRNSWKNGKRDHERTHNSRPAITTIGPKEREAA